MPNMRCLLGSA